MWPQLMACLNRQQFCGAAATCSFVEQTKLHLAGEQNRCLGLWGKGRCVEGASDRGRGRGRGKGRA